MPKEFIIKLHTQYSQLFRVSSNQEALEMNLLITFPDKEKEESSMDVFHFKHLYYLQTYVCEYAGCI